MCQFEALENCRRFTVRYIHYNVTLVSFLTSGALLDSKLDQSRLICCRMRALLASEEAGLLVHAMLLCCSHSPVEVADHPTSS